MIKRNTVVFLSENFDDFLHSTFELMEYSKEASVIRSIKEIEKPKTSSLPVDEKIVRKAALEIQALKKIVKKTAAKKAIKKVVEKAARKLIKKTAYKKAAKCKNKK